MKKNNNKNPNSEQLTLTVLIGPPCCGKTSWVKKNAKPNDLVVSIDDLLVSKHPNLTYNEAYRAANWKEIEKEFKATLLSEIQKAERNIIVDKTNLTSTSRRKLLATVGSKYKKVAVVFNWDVKVLKERNIKRAADTGKFISDRVIEDMVNNFVPIKYEEGFDKVIQVR